MTDTFDKLMDEGEMEIIPCPDGKPGCCVLHVGKKPALPPEKRSVFLVVRGDYSDFHIVGAFSTREKADTVVAAINIGKPMDDATAVEYELDSWDRVPAGHTVHRVAISKDGSASMRCTGIDNQYYLVEDYIRDHVASYDVADNLVLTAVATDEKHAVKIANEKRAFVLANDAWGDEEKTKQLLGSK